MTETNEVMIKKYSKNEYKAENRFRTIFDQAAVGVALTSMETGALLRVNKKYCDIVGYPEEKLNRLSFQDLTHPDDLQKDLDNMTLLKGKKISEFSMEKRYLRADGSTIWVNLTVSSMGGPKEQSDQHIAVIQDITEQKQLEQILLIQRDLAIHLESVPNLQDALSICLEFILKIDGIDGGGIYLSNQENGNIDLAVHMGLPDDFIQSTSHLEKDSPQVQLINRGRTVCSSYSDILDRMEMTPEQAELRLRSGLRYVLVIPILHEGRLVGALNLGSKKGKLAAEVLAPSLEAIAAQIAGVIFRLSTGQALEDSQRNLQTLFESLEDFLFIFDDSGSILGFNPAVEKRLGYTAQELRHMKVLDVHPPERQQEATEIMSKMFQGEASVCPIPLRCKNGRLIPVETKVTMGRWDGKRAIFGISRDISDRLKIEEEKRISEERLLAAIEAIDEGFVIYDAEDRLVMSNAKYREIYNTSKEILIPGKRFETILRYGLNHGQYPEARGREEEWFEERMRDHRSLQRTFEQKLPDNKWLKISERKTRQGSTVGFRVDITDIKQTEEKLQKALREKNSLLKEIHHRVKNNMQVISSLLNLQSEKYGDPKLVEAFRDIEIRVNAMAFVHETLYQSKTFSRINLRAYIEKLTASLSDSLVTEGVPAVIETCIEEISLKLKLAVPCGLIVTELVTNAVKYAIPPASGLIIKISALYLKEGNIQMTISDNGQGQAKVLDPMSTNTLGILLVSEIIKDQLDGSYRIEQDSGVTWVIQWPGQTTSDSKKI